MLGFLKPRGELVEIKGRTVVFLSAKPYRPDQKIEVRLGIPASTGQSITVALQVVSLRSAPNGLFIVVGVTDAHSKLANLKGYEVRAYPRFSHRVTVQSEDLPGYRAVTLNMGRGGFKVELAGELGLGKVVTVHFEFDEPSGWSLDLKARVVWSTWKSQKYYDTGFAFVEDPEFIQALDELAGWLEAGAAAENVPFKPPERGAILASHERKKQASAAPTTQAKGKMEPAIESRGDIDDDPTPLGLPTIVEPMVRQQPLKLPEPSVLERPHAIKLPSVALPAGQPEDSSDSQEPVKITSGQSEGDNLPSPSDAGVRVYFQANLRGWAWEGAEDTVVVVVEDNSGVDYWLEFPGCRRLGARCQKQAIRVGSMSVSEAPDKVARQAEEPTVKLWHYRFYDSNDRIALELVAQGCLEQVR